MQSTYAESVTGYSSFTHESDHPLLLGLKSHQVQKGKNGWGCSCLAALDSQQKCKALTSQASDRTRNREHIALPQTGRQVHRDSRIGTSQEGGHHYSKMRFLSRRLWGP